MSEVPKTTAGDWSRQRRGGNSLAAHQQANKHSDQFPKINNLRREALGLAVATVSPMPLADAQASSSEILRLASVYEDYLKGKG